MANKQYIENVRKISKTDEILKKLLKRQLEKDKGRIPASRGVALTPGVDLCRLMYPAGYGTYTMQQIIEGEGPRIASDVNHCDVLNTITQCYEIGDQKIHCTLRPDGQFLPDDGVYWYTGAIIMNGASGGLFPSGDYEPGEPTFYRTPEEVLLRETRYLVSIGQTSAEGKYTTYGAVEVSSTVIDIYNWATDYKFLVSVNSDNDGNYLRVYGYPANYDSTIDNWGGLVPQIFDYPDIPPLELDANGIYQPLPADSMLVFDNMPTISSSRGFQLGLTREDGKWYPSPEPNQAPLKYKNGVSVVIVGFGEDRVAKVEPAKNGSFIVYETISGTPTGTARVFDYQRAMIAEIPVAQLSTYQI